MKHGLSGTKLYRKWLHIKKRCKSTKPKSAKYYLDKNITICNEWKDNFISFYKWAIENGYKEGLTIDRIDPNKNYEPLNCRWVTRTVQSQNTRKIYSHNTTGYRGVTFIKSRNKYKSQISVENKRIFLGYHNTKIKAAKAYDDYIINNKLEHTLNF